MAVVTHLYDTYDDARRAMGDLMAAGIPEADISIVANNADNRFTTDGPVAVDTQSGAGTGTGVGATLGGIAGLLAGLGVMAIPGIGPVVAAGWLASTALGAVVGGAAGGVIGALTQAGIPEEDAHVYAEGLRQGGTLLTARVADPDFDRIDRLLSATAVDIETRRQKYESAGWSRFDEQARDEQIRRVREKSGMM